MYPFSPHPFWYRHYKKIREKGEIPGWGARELLVCRKLYLASLKSDYGCVRQIIPPPKKIRNPTPKPNLQTLKTTKFCGKPRHMKTPPPDDKQNDRTRIPERAKSRVKMVYLRSKKKRWRKSVFIPIKFWILFINQQNKHLMGNKKRVEMRALYKKNILRKNLNQSPNLVYRICKLHFLIRRPPPYFSRNFSYSINTLFPSPPLPHRNILYTINFSTEKHGSQVP